MAKTYITPKLFRFLDDLRENNNREWFQENKARYEADVRDPVLELIADFAPKLQRLSPHLVADSRPNGGSMFRIYRDVRFSKDKSPYKTHVGVRFPHEDAKNVSRTGILLAHRARYGLRGLRGVAPGIQDLAASAGRDRDGR